MLLHLGVELNELASHVHECLVYIVSAFGANLVACHLAPGCKLLEPGGLDFAAIAIGFVAEHAELDVGL